MGNTSLEGSAPKKIFINDEKAAEPLSLERIVMNLQRFWLPSSGTSSLPVLFCLPNILVFISVKITSIMTFSHLEIAEYQFSFSDGGQK